MPRDANEIYLKKRRERLDVAAAKAMPLALAGDFEAAENLIREVDSDIYGWLAMARMYIAAIASLGAANAAPDARALVKVMFERAVAHRENAYPMPHTQIEADSYEQGRSQDRCQVVREIGFDPNHSSNSIP